MENSAEVKKKLNVQWKPRRFVPYCWSVSHTRRAMHRVNAGLFRYSNNHERSSGFTTAFCTALELRLSLPYTWL